VTYTERKYERRTSREEFDIFDRRRKIDRREQSAPSAAKPGDIRPAANEWPKVERRRFPEAGTE
jgi:hypothetical protein